MLTLEDARLVIAAAERRAEEVGQPMNIAVVDAGGNLTAHVRMDDAKFASATIAINKAYTAVALKTETRELAPKTQPGGPLFGLSDAAGGRIVVFPGGVPLLRDGQVGGAVGVSSGTIEQDQDVATAGALALS